DAGMHPFVPRPARRGGSRRDGGREPAPTGACRGRIHHGAARRRGRGSVQHRAGGTAVTDELSLLDATAQAELVRTGQVTAVELVTAAIDRVEALNPSLNAVVTPVFEAALEAASTALPGPFAGVPYLLKDLACEMEGVRFTEGSRFLAGHVSAFD